MHNQGIEHNMAVFSELSFCCMLPGNAMQRLVKFLTTVAMVDNPAEKVDECPLN